jgi:hypothetical protein
MPQSSSCMQCINERYFLHEAYASPRSQHCSWPLAAPPMRTRPTPGRNPTSQVGPVGAKRLILRRCRRWPPHPVRRIKRMPRRSQGLPEHPLQGLRRGKGLRPIQTPQAVRRLRPIKSLRTSHPTRNQRTSPRRPRIPPAPALALKARRPLPLSVPPRPLRYWELRQ